MADRVQILTKCRRSAAEQRQIIASMKVFEKLPEKRRLAIRELVAEIARDAAEGRALWDAAVRGLSSTTVNHRTGVSVQRILAMKAEFYERCPL